MKTKTLYRWSGAAVVMSGLLAIVTTFLTPKENPNCVWLFIVQSLFTLFALFGVYAYQTEGSGVWGFVGFVVASTGNALFIAGEQIAGVEVPTLASSISALGLILLSIGIWKAGKFPKWVPVLWILAPLIGIPSLFVGGFTSVFILLASIVFGLGFVGAGYTLWSQGE